jgi:hypothetical protein
MSELINIWREVGAYNRFAETKNAVFLGLMLTLSGFLASGHDNVLAYYLFGGTRAVLFIFIGLASTASILALVPIMNFPTVFIGAGTKVTPAKPRNLYYFYHIAQFDSTELWLAGLQLSLSASEETRAQQLAEQIWVICKIASRKFFLLKVSSSIFVLGWALSWAARTCLPVQ